MEQLTAQDASFVYLEQPNTPMHVGGIAIYDPSTAPGGKVRFKDILAYMNAAAHLAPGFRQKLLRVPGNLDHPYWINDPDFDLEFHVRHIALPAPGDWRQLCIQAARLHARPLDMNRPLWEYYFVEGLDGIAGIPKGCFGVITKIHHAVIDGASGVEMMKATTSLTPDASLPTPPVQDGERKAPAGPGELLLRTYFNNLTEPMRWMRILASSLPGVMRVGQGISKGDLSLDQLRPAAPRTLFNCSVGPHRVFGGVEFKLADIKPIRKAVPGTTINDVMLAIVGGALRAYLLDHNDLPSGTLVAMAPISVRDDSNKGRPGNMVTAMLAPLGTDIADPLTRLAFVHAQAKKSKALTNAVGARTLVEYSTLMPGALFALGARLSSTLGIASRTEPTYNCVVTNVPGPPVPLYFAGSKMVAQYGFGPLTDGVALIHPIFSYCDAINVSFVSDRDVMPDPARYADCLREAFDALNAAADQVVTVAFGPAEPKRTKSEFAQEFGFKRDVRPRRATSCRR